MSCATELLHPANFCPVCGARLAAPVPDGSAATLPGGTLPAITQVPAEPPVGNVVQLPAPSSDATANPRAREYEGANVPPEPPAEQPDIEQPDIEQPTQLRPRPADAADPDVDAIRARAAEIAASLPAFGSHGPVPQPHEIVPPPRVEDNPFGDFFSDGPSAWLEDDEAEEDDEPVDDRRIIGTLLAMGAIGMAMAAWIVWGIGMYRGSGGAEAGGFVLLSMLLWVWYLSLPRRRQHAALLRVHRRALNFVDRRVTPIRDRTEGQLAMRRERDRYRSMRDERSRRIAALGESSYRAFRQGALPAELQSGAQRVLAIERLMLGQDQRIAAMQRERDAAVSGPETGDGHEGTDPAAGPP